MVLARSLLLPSRQGAPCSFSSLLSSAGLSASFPPQCRVSGLLGTQGRAAFPPALPQGEPHSHIYRKVSIRSLVSLAKPLSCLPGSAITLNPVSEPRSFRRHPTLHGLVKWAENAFRNQGVMRLTIPNPISLISSQNQTLIAEWRMFSPEAAFL